MLAAVFPFLMKKRAQPSKINEFLVKKWFFRVFTLGILIPVYLIDQVFDEMTVFTEKRVQPNKFNAFFTEK